MFVYDVYNCEECGHAFAVEKDAEVRCCSICESEEFEFSHEAEMKYMDPVKGEEG